MHCEWLRVEQTLYSYVIQYKQNLLFNREYTHNVVGFLFEILSFYSE